ncbi:uncharacterized protein KY384_002865 [Bacidia gigantensis]|uniref:uncharacterized protein n=1 Tax=Bacidia gigantensis TaxID=2732470 RepID=UPI001D03FEE2|nr:uncharacterized protein KY384_002865 [Bacidia gigantensis]KAG8532380.1 hypothetical protein KY384_002865 [Bacidia gigantensis]
MRKLIFPEDLLTQQFHLCKDRIGKGSSSTSYQDFYAHPDRMEYLTGIAVLLFMAAEGGDIMGSLARYFRVCLRNCLRAFSSVKFSPNHPSIGREPVGRRDQMPLRLAYDSDTDSFDIPRRSNPSQRSPDEASTRLALRKFFSKIKTHGDFATSGRIAGHVATGLKVNGVGRIAFPLIEHQAKQIIEVCHRAPFGQGHNTLVDERVRKTWELNPDQFQLSHPYWPSIIEKVTQEVIQNLGLPHGTAVRSNVYKLLLYEEGAMFKPHQDTEKEPGMFGTLAITLPSEYEGGAVLATHRGQSRTLAVDSPAFFHSYLTWYADVTHEVKPVTSGYRLVLTYNLVRLSGGPRLTASLALRQKDELDTIFSSWNRTISLGDRYGAEAFVYVLDHMYTDASLSLQALKGDDKMKAVYLQEACAQHGFCLYFATMEFERMESLSLRRIVDLDGNILIFAKQELQARDIVQEDVFDRDPDREDYSGYTGNEGVSATHWYNDTVMILMPLAKRHAFLDDNLRNGTVKINDWVNRLLQNVKADAEDNSAREDLLALCSSLNRSPVLKRTKSQQPKWSTDNTFLAAFESPSLNSIIEASVILHSQDLLESTMKNSALSLEKSEVYTTIGAAIYKLGLGPGIDSLDRLVRRFTLFRTRYQVIRRITHGFEEAARGFDDLESNRVEEMHTWMASACKEALQVITSPNSVDGVSLVRLVTRDPQCLTVHECLEIAKAHPTNTAFLIGIAVELLQAAKSSNADFNVADEGVGKLVENLLSSFTIECQTTTKRPAPGSQAVDSTVTCLMSAPHTADLLKLLQPISPDKFTLLLRRLSSNTSSCPPIAFQTFFIPLLTLLQPHALSPESDAANPLYATLFFTVLTAYITRYVQRSPVPKRNLSRGPEGCDSPRCIDCKRLDAFLADPDKESMDFAVDSGRRAHLHQLLTRTGCSHNTDRRRGDTLVVTKRMTREDRRMVEWEIRWKEARKVVGGLDRRVLRVVLGEAFGVVVACDYGGVVRYLKRVKGRREGGDVIDLT